MRSEWIERLFPAFALLLLTPWSEVYAYTYAGDMAGQDAVRIEVAETSAQPTWAAFKKATGGVTLGDLFYIDAIDKPAGIVLSLAEKATPSMIITKGGLL